MYIYMVNITQEEPSIEQCRFLAMQVNTSMARNFTFIDNLALKFFAVLRNRDIVILPLHPESAVVNNKYLPLCRKLGGGSCCCYFEK